MTSTVDGQLLQAGAEVEWLGSGYGAFAEGGAMLGVAEGPVWLPDQQALSFNDSGNAVRYRWTEVGGVTVARTGTHDANGSTRDRQGRLVSCEHATRRVSREEADGSVTVVADNYRGLALNRPNDVVVRSDGSIWFTDPLTFEVDTDLDFAGVYRVAPDLSRINLVTRDFNMPNGLAFSPDEQTLYINDTNRMHVRAFSVDSWSVAGARLDLDSDRTVITMPADRPGHPDGMKLDALGNIWCTGPGGIWVIAPDGTHLATLELPRVPVTNFCFGGSDLTTIFFTTFTEVGRIRVGVPGLHPDREIEQLDGPGWTADGRSD
ncbi:SMP-30/gluconolactonase/LRE family protein [Pseudonocardia sp. KRD291]|uniref:SMP-30/gluconolactonase/LRE family protein n=1 Tax=Pseudonocardia sp. KRD291 TaxID=2792007 RepID=UPI001C4A1ADA|nr:SMP-30/gluconolactonase/LRE family protein [Pseudonocardia sp. KRD291]MBW0101872.1 SMP-30/gluconolactonase/LRE family protein [Pseudonocardia sp. KRD291]